ncbi:substrate-binding domain-containing protein [Paenibacillus sp. PAMC21692]|uniref:GntR family transcriptional regulator n=1 Tax=Paenibacillus sp. PAMC21692 TaxID=2762320 RepID=UPI00164DC0F5|nr:GntR family transcriptional regulator [Paenibacillus sp. PAMC21692]QNK57270.1 GntR family transcriptional regulator [Paenibacillus sp. PAMC21692]
MSRNKTPLYRTIRTQMRGLITNQSLRPGDQLPTETELMQRFQTSRATVTAAIRGLVEEGLVYRVAGKGTFVVDDSSHPVNEDLPLAGAEQAPVRTGSTSPARTGTPHKGPMMLGVIMFPGTDQLMSRLLISIESRSRQEGYALVFRTAATQAEENAAIYDLIGLGVQGLIIYPLDGEIYNEAILELKLQHFPFVLIDRYLPGIKTNAVDSDNYAGGAAAAEYLLDLGHEKIGVVSSTRTKTSSSDERFQGYLDVMTDRNIDVSPQHWLIGIDDSHAGRNHDKSVTRIYEWLAAQRELTAIFTLQPFDAIYTATAAERLGLRIPEDISVISFDNPGILDLHKPFFTHIEQDFEQIGQTAVELLIHAIENASQTQQLHIPVRLLEGRSARALAVQRSRT